MANESIIAKGVSYYNSAFTFYLTKIVVALIILLLGFIIGRILGKVVQRLLHEIETDKVIKSTTKIRTSIEDLIGRFVSYFIYFVTIIMALSQLGLSTTVLHIITAAVILIIVISIVLAVKDFIPNMIAGFIIYEKRLFKKGEFIKVGTTEGKVIHVSLIDTRIETKSKDVVYLPNSIIVRTGVTKLRKKK